ncbi:sensor domain-containing protein [Mycobacterium sp.]|uniref:sensor domain-containing protein n=1 Tax=Mycobacterium sp. TaxID=1785 RepID=UPI002DA2C4EE|nr:sensor domain-containing protein [Mycobacterium sp.]
MTITVTNKSISTLARREATRTRGTVVRLATASVLAGIAAAASAGTAAAAPGAPLPAFTGPSSLEALLLTDREVAAVVGARNLVEIKSGNRLGHTAVRPSECTSAYAPFQAAAYAGTDPQDVAFKVISDGRKQNLLVSEAVVQLGSKSESLAHLEATADAWDDCKGLTVSSTSGGWVLDAPRVNDDRTIVTLGQTSANGGSTCERAIASYRDIFIDVMSCSSGRAEGQGAKLVQEIAAKADSQPL